MQQINYGAAVNDTQINNKHNSNAAFHNDFAKIMETSHIYHNNKDKKILKASFIDTPLGAVFAIADEKALFLLEFVDKHKVERQVEKLYIKTKSVIIPGITSPIDSIAKELKSYFDGSLKDFKTPLNLIGTTFQEVVWSELCQIPYGTTKSYADQASVIEKQSAYRAVANANGANKIVIMIPCHRVIRNNGQLGGYGAGIARKRWLLDHEQKNK